MTTKLFSSQCSKQLGLIHLEVSKVRERDHSSEFFFLFLFFKFSPKIIFIDFGERGRERERNIDQLPPLHVNMP